MKVNDYRVLFKVDEDERFFTYQVGDEIFRKDKSTQIRYKFNKETDLWYQIVDDFCPHCGSLLNNKLGC